MTVILKLFDRTDLSRGEKSIKTHTHRAIRVQKLPDWGGIHHLVIYSNWLPRDVCSVLSVNVCFLFCVGLHACRHECLLRNGKRDDLPPRRWPLKTWNATLQNNEGVIHVPFLCLTCQLLRCEFPQNSNKFRTADHKLYKASGDTSKQYGGKLEKPAQQAMKTKIKTSTVPKWWLSI